MEKVQAAWPHAAVGLAAGTRVLTPIGWSELNQLRCGDQVVDVAGQACSVVRVRDVGVAPVFELAMADGSLIQGAADQPWQVEVGKGSRRTTRQLTTTQIQDLAARKVGVRLLRSGALQTATAPRPRLDPYVLGALLGDGSFACGRSVKLWTCEEEIRRHVERALPPGTRFSSSPTLHPTTTGWGIVGHERMPGSNGVLNALRELGLSGLQSYDKFVPRQYLWTSVEDRLALLQGLCDTDGAADLYGQVSFSSASPQLAADVVHLVRSLGGRCVLHRRTNVRYTSPTQLTPKCARDSYKVGGIRLFDFSPFRLARKAERVRPAGKTPQWTVRTVTPSGTARLMTMEVDSTSGLFLANDFIPVSSLPSAAVGVDGRRLAA